MATIKEKNFLSGEEICKIMETCAKTKVVTMKCGPLELSFAPVQEIIKLAPEPVNSASNPQEINEVQTKAAKDAIEEDEIRTREDQLVELSITDPLRLEEMITDGELVETEELEQDD